MPTMSLYMGKEHCSFSFEAPALISQELQERGVGFALPCGGNRTCKKCRVTAYGELSPLSLEERETFSPAELEQNLRLACCTVALGDCTVVLPKGTSFFADTFEELPSVGDASPFGSQGVAAAVDIGTTTIAVYLVNLTDSHIIARLGEENQQKCFGADVISRIACAQEKPGPLQKTVCSQLDRMIGLLLAQTNIPKQAVKGMAITGNTTMLHLLCGLDASGIAAAPFVPQSLFGVMYSARELFRSLPASCPVYLCPCVSAYAGADLVCAALSCKMEENSLVVDIGTNGEMALFREGRLLCVAAAAGPAFEGAGLSMGMPAKNGAVKEVFYQDGRLSYQVVGAGPAQGICGTGAVDALAFLLEQGALDETGLLLEEGHPFSSLIRKTKEDTAFLLGDSGVMITQRDIRQLQLAKAAIAAGIDTLLYRGGCQPQDITSVYIAGGFGSWLNPYTAGKIGLLPPSLIDRCQSVGNAAGAGACLCALSETFLVQAQTLAQTAQEVSLSQDPYFMEQYIHRMLFYA